jgi:hypothetical protein
VSLAEVSEIEPTGTGSGTIRKIRGYRQGPNLWCEFLNQNGDQAETAPVNVGTPADGLAGLRVYDAHVHFRSFVVYQ